MEITPGPWQAQREGLDFWQEFFRPVEPPRRESRPPAGRIEGAGWEERERGGSGGGREEPREGEAGSGGGGVEAAENAAKKGEAGKRRQEMQPRKGELA